MAEKMLIDASHPEETRVVVVRGNRIEEFDFESEHKKQLRGNIYLAKVTRVEPSLQAAFVDYGGNRHGFLAFSEIHPDYYQIPLADFANVNGLTAQNGQAFDISPESGSLFLWNAGDGPTGEVIGFAQESSNADIAGELTSLIETQRAYASNASVLRTVDEMLQETTNIKR